MPSPEAYLQAGKLLVEGASEMLPEATGAGAKGMRELNLLGLMSEVPGASRLEAFGAPGERMAVDGGPLSRNFASSESAQYVTDQQLASFRGHELTKDAWARTPTGRVVTLDDSYEPGRTYRLVRPSVAQVARVAEPHRLADGMMAGTGMVLRSDGLTATSLHTLEGAPKGDIFLKFPNHPVSVKANVVARDTANDLALLRPRIVPTGGYPVRPVPLAAMEDSARTGARAISFGYPNLRSDLAGNMTGNLHFAEGELLDRGRVSYLGTNRAADMYWTNIPGEFGMSGALTVDRSTGKVIGLMNEGLDYQNSAIIPTDKIKRILRGV